MMENKSAGAYIEVDDIDGTHQVVRTNDIQKLHKAEQIQELMQEIDEKINLFVSLTNQKGLAVKQRWRAIKKNAGIKQERS